MSEKLGKYDVLEKIGEGGFGAVWLGRDPFLKRTVAIKTCSAENEEFRKRFLREAEIAGGLQHPNVVMVHDFGYHDGVPYLVQELLDGEDLSERIRRREPISEQQVLDWLIDIARGLGYAHSKGIVHRDVKPGNVRITGEGVAKVMDFGIARLAQMDTRLTKTGTALGTVAYMSPEQVNGETVDHRADIFAFGVVAYELLTFQRPFEAETMSRIFYRILHDEPRPIVELVPGASVELERVVLRCLAKEPALRYQDFDTVLDDLVTVREGGIVGDSALSQTAIVDPAERETKLLAPRPAPPGRAGTRPASASRPLRPARPATGSRSIDEPTRRLADAPAPAVASESTAYNPPRPSRLPRLVAAGAGVGVLALGGLWLLGRAPEPTAPAPAATSQRATPAPAAAEPAVSAPAPLPRDEVARLVEAEVERREVENEKRLAAALAEQRRALERPVAPATPDDASKSAAPPATAEPMVTPPPLAAATSTPAPAVEIPAATPAPTAPPAAPTPDRGAADVAAVRAVLAEYEAAYERLDAAAVARVWPDLGAARERDLARAFANYRRLAMTLSDCDVAVEGDRATARCRLRQEFELKVGRATPRDAAVRFRLRRAAGGWRIDAVEN